MLTFLQQQTNNTHCLVRWRDKSGREKYYFVCVTKCQQNMHPNQAVRENVILYNRNIYKLVHYITCMNYILLFLLI